MASHYLFQQKYHSQIRSQKDEHFFHEHGKYANTYLIAHRLVLESLQAIDNPMSG